jgi:SAM-dependent methyltransferase
MERFWDARAREDAYYFVDSRLEYRSPDEEAFWAGGEEALDKLLGVLEAPPIEADDVVVDIGCGIGRLTRPLAGRASRVFALDVSSEMIERARRLNEHLDNVEWLHGDGESLQPIPDASVDACVSHVVFRHIPDPAITLRYVLEMGRVLRPGAFAAFEFSNKSEPHVHRSSGRYLRLRGLVGRAPRGVTDSAWVGSHVELEDLRRVAAQAGLRLERVRGEGTDFCAVLLRRTDPVGIGANAADRPESEGVARYYDDYWDADEEPFYEPDPALAHLIFDGVGADVDCLDVGCGAGRSYAPRLAARARSYVGVDVSPTAVDKVRSGGLEARVIEDAATLPFPDNSFDHVVCVEVLEHLFEPDRAVAEIWRVLRPGGTMVASAPNIAYWRLRFGVALGVWNPVGDELSIERPWRDPHIRFFTPSTMERMLRLGGFGRVNVGAHGGRGLDHVSHRHTEFGESRLYRLAERRFPGLFGLTIHAKAVK